MVLIGDMLRRDARLLSRKVGIVEGDKKSHLWRTEQQGKPPCQCAFETGNDEGRQDSLRGK